MTDDKGSKSLTERVGLWLHRTLIRLRLLPGKPKETASPDRSEAEQPIGSVDFDDQWQIFRTGFLTVSAVFLVDVLALSVLWVFVGPTTEEILLISVGLVALNLIVSLWVLIRIRQSVVDPLFGS